ncbi:hypothetical protein T492DRAFT_869807, partial [Pavlovales sp. CCMP2436]
PAAQPAAQPTATPTAVVDVVTQPAAAAADATAQNLNVVIATPIVVIGGCCVCWVAAFIYRRRIFDYARGEKKMVVTGDLVVTAGPPAFV